MKKDKNSALRYVTLILPPAVTAFILLVIFAVNGMYPFGGKTLAVCDMHQQVVPLLLDFKDVLSGKSDPFYSFGNASGMNVFGVFLFFIASPFSLLAALVDKGDMLCFMNIVTLLKLMVCAVTANAYFRHCHKSLSPVLAAILSVMYAFSGYSMLFYQNTVWLDVMYFFPLLMMSLEAMTERGKIAGFVLCLCGMMALNYYLSYMVVLFVLLYFGLYLIIYRGRMRVNAASRFWLACLIAAMASAVVWLPSFAQYLSSARGSNLIEGLAGSKIFVYLDTSLTLLLCTSMGIAVLAMFPALKLGRRAVLHAGMFFLMLIPMILEPINKMWHTGDYMAFPVRYGYMVTFMMLCFAAAALRRVGGRNTLPRTAAALAAASAGFGVLTVFFYYEYREDLDAYITTIWGDKRSFTLLLAVAFGFILLYAAAISAARSKKLTAGAMAAVICVLTVSECVFSSNVYIAAGAYEPDVYDSVTELENKIEDESFFRVKTAQADRKLFDANLPGGLGYGSISHYTSLTSEDYMFAMKRLGYSSYWMEVSGSGGTMFTDALMSIKYTIANNGEPNAVYRGSRYAIYRNGYCLPLGIVTDGDLSLEEELPPGDRISVEEHIASTLFGAKSPLFKKYEHYTLKDVKYTETDEYYMFKLGEARIVDKKPVEPPGDMRYIVNVSGRQALYFDCFDEVSRDLTEHINGMFAVFVNGKRTAAQYPSSDSNGLLYLGTFEDEVVDIDVRVLKSGYCSSFGVYGLDCVALAGMLRKADSAQLVVDGREITGVADGDEGEYLYLSVPYDSGFKAYVNGDEAELMRTFTGFMSLKLEDGENEIRIAYTPPGLAAGVIVSVVGVVAAVLVAVFKKRVFAFIERFEKPARILSLAALFGVLIVVYIMPMAAALAGKILLLVK